MGNENVLVRTIDDATVVIAGQDRAGTPYIARLTDGRIQFGRLYRSWWFEDDALALALYERAATLTVGELRLEIDAAIHRRIGLKKEGADPKDRP